MPGSVLALLAGIVMAALAALLAVDMPSTTQLNRILIGAGLGGLGIALLIVAHLRLRRALSELERGVRALGSGRAEVRMADNLPGSLGAVAQDLNRVAQQLTLLRNQFDERVAAHTQRLKIERDQLVAQNQNLRSAAGQAQEEARAQSELLSGLSHELRTPLTGILGYTDLLRRSGLNIEQSHQLETLEKSARTLLTMINDLLDWSRIEAGRLRLNEETFNLIDSIEDTCALLAPLAYEKDLELVRIVYHDVPRQLRGDAQRLRQILTNLLSNAIKFTEHGEVVLRVMREREDAGRAWLRFSVTDTGVGIEPEQQSRLFQPYRQVGRPSVHGGSGLGLSITRKLTELIGGEISLSSSPGQGSTFSVLLPFKLTAEAESAPTHDRSLSERSVWIYEPHATARLALVHWLEFWGMQVRAFDDPQTITSTLKRGVVKPDLVIAGLKPPDTENPAIRDLLAACAAHEPPLMALVASAALPLHDAICDAGAAACHPKSLGRQRLHDEVLRLTTEASAPTAQPLLGRRALVADNNLTNRRYLSVLCQSLGLEVIEAADGRAAVGLWERERPGIVLLDAHMPGLSGAECAQAIRRLEGSGARSRILAVSAHLEPEERLAFLNAGADEILIKPFDDRQLLRALEPAAAGNKPVAAKLTTDPELLSLLCEELPQQYADLERAFGDRNLDAARDAAHTLRGTAAFYHLASLRQTTSALEDWLKRATGLQAGVQSRRELDNVRRAVDETLSAINRP